MTNTVVGRLDIISMGNRRLDCRTMGRCSNPDRRHGADLVLLKSLHVKVCDSIIFIVLASLIHHHAG